MTGWPPADDNNHIMVVVTLIGSGSLGSRVAGEGPKMMMMMMMMLMMMIRRRVGGRTKSVHLSKVLPRQPDFSTKPSSLSLSAAKASTPITTRKS